MTDRDEALAGEAERVLAGWKCQHCRWLYYRDSFGGPSPVCRRDEGQAASIKQTGLLQPACEHFERSRPA